MKDRAIEIYLVHCRETLTAKLRGSAPTNSCAAAKAGDSRRSPRNERMRV